MTKPTTTIREGAIGLSVWQREGKYGTFFEFTISRCFQKSDGTFGYSTSFHESNAEALGKAIQQATVWMREYRQKSALSSVVAEHEAN